MSTLTVRDFQTRDAVRLRRVGQRRVNLRAPWIARSRFDQVRQRVNTAVVGIGIAAERLVSEVDGEICGYALFDRDDEHFRWYATELGAGSPRVDATGEVAIELWAALLEDGIRRAGEQGVRRIFAFARPESTENHGILSAGFQGYASYLVLRGREFGSLAAFEQFRPQHESDLWSIHQLYNHSTPRSVQFAEALTSDSWSVEPGARFRQRNGLAGFVVPEEDGIAAACRVDSRGSRPIVTLLCDDQVSDRMPAFVATSLEEAGIDGAVDVIVPGYLQHLVRDFVAVGFSVSDERVGLVRHTTAPAIVESTAVTRLPLAKGHAAVTYPFGASGRGRSDGLVRNCV